MLTFSLVPAGAALFGMLAVAGIYLRLARRPVTAMDATVARFRIASAQMRQRIGGIPRAFLMGYNSMLTWRRLHRIKADLTQLDDYYRPFALEGSAMGYAARVCLHPLLVHRWERVINLLMPEDLYQNYVGLGWWLDLWCRGSPRRIQAYTARLDRRYHLLPYEGIGFRLGFMNPDMAEPPGFEGFPDTARRACVQGYGRSLWFSRSGDLADVRRRLAAMPAPLRGDAYSGFGLAVGFTTVEEPERALEVREEIPAAYRWDFVQGLAFGWETRRRHDQPHFEIQISRLPEAVQHHIRSAVAAVHRSIALMRPHATAADYYHRWRILARDLIAETELFTTQGAD